MPGVRLERDVPVTALEDPAPVALSDEDVADAAADNANFGPQDFAVVDFCGTRVSQKWNER